MRYQDELLRESDDILFLHGACHVFALVLNECFGHRIVTRYRREASGKKSDVHVYCRFRDGYSVDVVGIACEEIALAELGWGGSNFSTEEVSPDGLKEYYKSAGGGLCGDADFLHAARKRAQACVDRYQVHYSGSTKESVPGFSRSHKVPLKDVQKIFE